MTACEALEDLRVYLLKMVSEYNGPKEKKDNFVESTTGIVLIIFQAQDNKSGVLICFRSFQTLLEISQLNLTRAQKLAKRFWHLINYIYIFSY